MDALYLAHRSKQMKEVDPSDLVSKEMKRIRSEVTAITKADRSLQAEVRGRVRRVRGLGSLAPGALLVAMSCLCDTAG